MLCSRCKRRPAVVFMTRMEGTETINEGLCLKCAKELGIKPVDDMMKQMGITDEELEDKTMVLSQADPRHSPFCRTSLETRRQNSRKTRGRRDVKIRLSPMEKRGKKRKNANIWTITVRI